MMKKKAYLLVFDGLADWEAALALCEINNKKALEVVTAGFSSAAITTMGGIPITPQTTLAEVKAEDTGIFILPGGHLWEQQAADEKLLALLQTLHQQGVPIAASGIGSVEFAYEIIKALNLYGEPEAREWFDFFKHAIIPEALRDAANGD